jgi:hypothetical protein
MKKQKREVRTSNESATKLTALTGGLAGALIVTAVHEAARRVVPGAPRLDTLGRRAIVKGMRRMNLKPPSGAKLQRLALAGDLVSNSLFYGLAGAGAPGGDWLRGSLLGLGMGLGAVALPGTLKLGRWPTRRSPATKVMTVGWYLAGGLAAAAVSHWLRGRREEKSIFA